MRGKIPSRKLPGKTWCRYRTRFWRFLSNTPARSGILPASTNTEPQEADPKFFEVPKSADDGPSGASKSSKVSC